MFGYIRKTLVAIATVAAFLVANPALIHNVLADVILGLNIIGVYAVPNSIARNQTVTHP